MDDFKTEWDIGDNDRNELSESDNRDDAAPHKQISGKKKLPSFLRFALWVVSVSVAIFFVPYIDIFPRDRFEPPDFAKPLLYILLVSMILRWFLGAVFGEKGFVE